MDALSTAVPSLRTAVGGTSAAFLSPHLRETQLLKPSSSRRSILSTTKPTIIPSSSLSHQSPRPLHLSSPRSSSSIPLAPSSKPPVHRRASTGYAAALLDAARCAGDGVLTAVEQDVRRMDRIFRKVMALRSVDETRKGEVMREAAECGGFDRRLVTLVRMLVGKEMVGMVGEVMEEFGRICDELSGTRVVVVAAERRMKEREVAGIAREVQRASGAARVKVRHVFGESLPRWGEMMDLAEDDSMQQIHDEEPSWRRRNVVKEQE